MNRIKKYLNELKSGVVVFVLLFVLSIQVTSLHSQVRPNHVFNNNMVLQREKPVKVWGWATPGEEVKVEFNGQEKTTVTSDSGEWQTFFDPMTANAEPQDFIISTKDSLIQFSNVLVGDVWVLGGQSNMEFDLIRIFHGDVEMVSANFPEIRLLTIPSAEGPKQKKNFECINEYDSWLDRFDEKGCWFVCSPERVETFSAMGYIFGKRIHLAAQIPVGLIDVSRGGTTVESWISPESLKKYPENDFLLNEWNKKVEEYDPEENLKTQILNWEKRTKSRLARGLTAGPKPTEPSPNPILDKNFPGSCYNGMIAPVAGATVKGILFHHGYNNALADARPKLYEFNFKALITDWRNTFNDSDLPFGIVELSAGGIPQTMDNFEAAMIDAAPFIREAQLQSFLDMENVGFAPAYDQQVNWYHPQRKKELSERIARWALSTQYGFDLDWEPAMPHKIELSDTAVLVTFNKEVATFDDRPVEGFAVADNSGHYFPASANYIQNGMNEWGNPIFDKSKLVITSAFVPHPVSVRYAWARNPLGNLVSAKNRIIPVPLFRSDNNHHPEAPYGADNFDQHREKLRMLKQEAEKRDKKRTEKKF